MKMKKYQVTIFIIILFTILFSFSLATNHEPLDQSTTSTNNFEDILKNDPAKAFEQDQAKAIDSITSNPSLLDNPQVLNALKDPKVLDQAFSKNPSQISKIINKKVELLEDTNVLNKYDKAIQSDLTLLNNNPQAKIKWIGKKYNIKMDLKSSGKPVDIESYDGNNIKTGGSKGLKFRAKDFPKANVLQDGSLKTQTGLFSNVKELSIVKDSTNNPKIVMRGGSIMSQPSNSHHDLDLKDGAKMRKFVFDQGEQIPITIESVKGTIKIRLNDPSDKTKSKLLSIESIGFNKIQSIDKKLLVKGNLKIDSLLFDKFDFKSPASIKDLKTGTTIDVQGKKNFKYITNSIHLESDYCEKSACILNEYKQNSHPKRQGRISVNRLDGHEVTIKSKAYQDIVETNEIIKGDFTFFSINDNGNVLSEIKVGPKGSIKVKNQKGKLTNTKVGRFDVFYKDSDGKTMQKHWSSKNLLQKKNRKFFRSKNKFVTCQVGVNCELQFAKNFGKVKFARGKKGQYKHAIFVGGDHPSTAISALKSKKCIKEGCIVLNSRDIPKNSNAQEWTITGHHLEQSEFLWRDCPTASGGEHCAIDQVRLVNDLPKAKNLKKISFSACNTINGNENDMSVNLYLAKMAQKYYGTNFVGVSGTELYHREFDDLTGKIKYKNWKSGKDKREGKRVSFLYDSQKDRYVYNDGDIKFSVDIDILVEESENQLSFNVPVGGEVSEQEI